MSDKLQYTGFTTKCRKCGVEVKSKYLGQNEDNVACYQLYCACKPVEEKSHEEE